MIELISEHIEATVISLAILCFTGVAITGIMKGGQAEERVKEMVMKGADPISAACAIYGGTDRNALCMTVALKEKQ